MVGSVVQVGNVALHTDGHDHFAVILGIKGDICEALFFSSNPEWSEKYRRATVEELAMAGFVQTRPTFLAYAERSLWDFTPVGRSFPSHWIDSLRVEFCSTLKLVQIEG